MTQSFIVTGAGGGVGLTLSGKLARQGHNVIAMVLDAAEASRLRAAVPGISSVLICDLADANAVAAILSPALSALDQELAGIVTCAGVWPGAPLETTSLAEVRRTIEINTIAPLAVYQASIPLLRKSRGRIVFVSSISGKLALPFNGAYAMSKFALEGMADTARREVSHWGIEVIVIEPGPIKTPMVTGMIAHLERATAALSAEERHLYGDLYAAFAAMVKKGYPSASDPDKVAAAILDALETKTPRTRVPVGPVAEAICAMPGTVPDRQIDAIAISVVTGQTQ